MSEKAILTADSVQTNFCRRVLRLPRTAPTFGLWWETGLLPVRWSVMEEKLKFVQHLEWREEDSLAATLWRLEKEERIDGLKGEIKMMIQNYSLPPPTRLLNKDMYKVVLK